MKIGALAKSRIENNLGLTLVQIRSMSIDEQIKYLESRAGEPMSFPSNKKHLKRVRGNVALGNNRFKTIEQVNKKMDDLIALREKEIKG